MKSLWGDAHRNRIHHKRRVDSHEGKGSKDLSRNKDHHGGGATLEKKKFQKKSSATVEGREGKQPKDQTYPHNEV